MFSRFSLRALLVTGISIITVSTAAAQSNVLLEGNAAYSVRGTRSNAAVTASISRVANYCYECTYRVQLILTLSRTPYSPSRGVSGQTIASSSQFSLSPRTYMANVTATGRASLPSGRYFPIMLAVDPVTRTIYSGTGFNRQLTARSIAKNVPALRRLTLRNIKKSGADAPTYTEIAGRNTSR